MCDPSKKNSTHGGYLEGKITIPGYKSGELYMRLSCLADLALEARIRADISGQGQDEHLEDVVRVSPLILHNLKFDKRENSHKKVRRNELEQTIRRDRPCLLYRIFDGRVYLDGTLITTMKNESIWLGNHYDQMNIVPLTPNKRCNSAGITISSVVEERLKLIDRSNWEHHYGKIIKFHDNSLGEATKRKRKDGNEELFRVGVEIFRDENCRERLARAETGRGIRNNATLTDIEVCEPRFSELQGGRSILIVCKGKSCRDVIPVFRVVDTAGNVQEEETRLLKQPETKKIERYANTLKFETPEQDLSVIQQIQNNYPPLAIKLQVKKEYEETSESRIQLDFKYISDLAGLCDLFSMTIPPLLMSSIVSDSVRSDSVYCQYQDNYGIKRRINLDTENTIKDELETEELEKVPGKEILTRNEIPRTFWEHIKYFLSWLCVVFIILLISLF